MVLFAKLKPDVKEATYLLFFRDATIKERGKEKNARHFIANRLICHLEPKIAFVAVVANSRFRVLL